MTDSLLSEPLEIGPLGGPRVASNLPYASLFTEALDIPVIVVGGFHTRDAMEAAITSSSANAVSAARAFTADTYLYRAVTGDSLEHPICGYCNGCIARFSGPRIDCYSDDIRAQRETMLHVARSGASTKDERSTRNHL
ncbi:hypothetical protein ACFXG4_35195 [Nocardia sp. NPDC059246]|uniref:hypothetical protein n=1 Tax=unclassified Nocardia TaxID=2637762 RepID=UPI00368B7721